MHNEKVKFVRIPKDRVGFGVVNRGWVGASRRVG